MDINYDEQGQSGTSEPNAPKPSTSTRTRPSTRSTNPDEITVENLGRKANRKDRFGRTPREHYKYVKWVKPANDTRKTHKSFLDENDHRIVIRKQSVPGECILCPKQKFLVRKADSELHYESVHHKSALVFRNIKILRCKCSEVRSRGCDKSTRNAHYHCTFCFHPSDYRHQLAKHLYSKHDVSSAECEELIRLNLTSTSENE